MLVNGKVEVNWSTNSLYSERGHLEPACLSPSVGNLQGAHDFGHLIEAASCNSKATSQKAAFSKREGSAYQLACVYEFIFHAPPHTHNACKPLCDGVFMELGHEGWTQGEPARKKIAAARCRYQNRYVTPT